MLLQVTGCRCDIAWLRGCAQPRGMGQQAWVRISAPAFPGEGIGHHHLPVSPQVMLTPTPMSTVSGFPNRVPSITEKVIYTPTCAKFLFLRPRKDWDPGHFHEGGCISWA